MRGRRFCIRVGVTAEQVQRIVAARLLQALAVHAEVM